MSIVSINPFLTNYKEILSCDMMYVYILLLLYSETNVMFSLLNREAFDYIECSRIIYDMKQNHFDAFRFNLKFDDIKSVIEFGQLGKGKILHGEESYDRSIAGCARGKYLE